MNNRKLNVLIAGGYNGKSSSGGVVNYSNQLLKSLNYHNVNAHYFSFGKSPKWYRGSISVSKFSYRIKHVSKVFSFCNIIKKKKINLVHLNSGFEANSLIRQGFFSFLAKVCGCKTVHYFHGWRNDLFLRIVSNFFLKTLLLTMLHFQNKIILSSKARASQLFSLGISTEKIYTSTTMTNVVDFKSDKKITDKVIQCLFLSKLNRSKGILEFLLASEKIASRYDNIHFNVVGGGISKVKLLKLAKKRGVSDRFTFHGFVSNEEKIDILKKSNLLVFPSYREGFPNVVVEALASGLTIITTPVGGLLDHLKNGKNGIILNKLPPSVSEIVSAINYLLKDIERLHRIGNYNMNTFSKRFDSTFVSKNIKDIYIEVLTS